MANTPSRSDSADPGQPTRGADATDEGSALEPDDVFHLLQTSRRRHVLRHLRTAEEPVLLRDLAERIAAREHDTTVENLTSSQRQRVYISLYQTHLPKLDNRGIVDYDKDRGTVEPTPLAAQFDPYLTGIDESGSDPWPYRYAGTVGCCGAGLGAVAAGFLPISWTAAAPLVVLTFAAVTALHVYSELVAA